MGGQSGESFPAGVLGSIEAEITVGDPLVEPFEENPWLDRVARRVGFGLGLTPASG